MPHRLKDFKDLKSLRATLKEQEAAKQAAEALRIENEKKSRQDADLFKKSIGNITPLPAQNKIAPTPTRPLPVARQRTADDKAILQASLSDEFIPETLFDTENGLSYVQRDIGQDVLRKLRRGHWKVDSELDLHGLRIDQARQALTDFIVHARKRGHRCVCIIHGKGYGSRNQEPVLKNKVHHWLAQKNEILAFCQAQPAYGGAGAVIALLRA